MNKIPAELHGVIVTQFHDSYCHCPSNTQRPAVWDTARADIVSWDNRTAKQFQRALCLLRLVSKCFYGPATTLLYSHGTFTLDVSYYCSSAIQRQLRYANDRLNQSYMANITGLRIDLLLAGFDRLLEFLDRLEQPIQRSCQVDAGQIRAAENARNDLLRALPKLDFPVDSMTALELRLDEPSHGVVDGWRYDGIWKFVNCRLPNITDLYIRGSFAGECSKIQPGVVVDMQGTGADRASIGIAAIIYSMTLASWPKIRRLLLSVAYSDKSHYFHQPHPLTPMNYRPTPQVLPQVSRFINLDELSLCGLKGAVQLHPRNTGLTNLYLSDITTAAENLIVMMTRGPILASGAMDSSPLVELVISNVRLGQTQLSDKTWHPGTWSQVFPAIAARCPRLTVLHTQSCIYTDALDSQPDQAAARSHADSAALDKLARAVRARPGASVTGVADI
ncbi:hypothetical protein BT67DRAFT_435041 [Trichocladium antarcticum]|uniref:Uncharacterized protein n=1 Tax=Trichocladium antarcticum TaxID=1450529 RepID=A0AAN6UHK0_9PEZI|nr:hypothetical protein BT67DRAFT_435041 [Trichocladium antarcticum]